MTIIKSSFFRKVRTKESQVTYILLSIVLFVLLPLLTFLSPVILSIPGINGCLTSLFFLCLVHVGLPIVIALARYFSWQVVVCNAIIFVILEYVCSSYYSKYFYNFAYWLWLAATSNASYALYIFGIKGIFEAWNRRKTKNFWWAIFLASPLLAVLGLTIFVGFFLVVNCFIVD